MLVFLVMSGSVEATPPHKWFDEADIDLVSITGLVTSSLAVCDDALNWSLLVNCTVDGKTSLRLTYEEGALAASIEAVKAVDALLFFSLDDLEDIVSISGSNMFLRDMIVPLEWFVDNVSLFVEQHEQILMGFSTLVTGSFSEVNGSSAQEVLGGIRSAVSFGRKNLRDAGVVLDSVSWVVEDDALLAKIQRLEMVLDQYDRYVDEFVGFFPDGIPLITLFSSQTVVYLSEELDLFGYCMAGSRFIGNESVWVYQNGTQIGMILADDYGRYEFKVPVDFSYYPGNYEYYASMFFDSVWYDSVVVEVEVRRIPIFVDIDIFPRHVYVNESVMVSGRVVDYNGIGVGITGFVSVVDDEVEFETNDGFFSVEYPVGFGFGRYSGYVYVGATLVYQGVVSDKVWFYVDTPTVLVLTTPRVNITVDDDVILVGSLVSGVDGLPLANKSVSIVFGNSVVGSSMTNSFGGFEYVFSSDEFGTGLFEFKAVYVSDEDRWRGSQSDPLMVNMGVSLFAFLPLIVILVVVGLGFVFLWVFRDRLGLLFGQVAPVKSGDVLAESGRPRLRFARRIGRSFQRVSRGARLTQDAVRDAVFGQYRLLLRFLVAEGVVVGPTDTHIDLQNRMHSQGFPYDSVDVVTETFEQAMYSLQPVSYEQLLAFDQCVFQLMTRAGV